MKKFVLPVLGILMLGLSGCNKEKSDDIVFFRDIPAILGYDRTIGQAILITPGETFLAPELGDYLYYGLLLEDDALMTYFYVNRSRQPRQDYRTVTMYDWTIVDVASPIEADESEIDKLVPIDSMFCYAFVQHDRINVLYCGFYHKDTYFRTFDYEMTFDDEETGDVPTLSVRAKEKGSQALTKASFWWVYAFDMYEYLDTLERDSENKVRLNIRFKTGEDDEENEIWDDIKGNPLIITFKEGE